MLRAGVISLPNSGNAQTGARDDGIHFDLSGYPRKEEREYVEECLSISLCFSPFRLL